MNLIGGLFLISLTFLLRCDIIEGCDNNLQCSGHNLCINKQCQLCKKNEDCGDTNKFACRDPNTDDAKCISCLTSGGSCKNTGECCACKECVCAGKTCISSKICKEDKECPSGKVCEHYSNFVKICVPSCNGGGKQCDQKSINHREYCKNGHCVPCEKEGKKCKDKENCCYGLVCSGGSCQTPPTKPHTKCKGTMEPCINPHECCNGGACKFYSQKGTVCQF